MRASDCGPQLLNRWGVSCSMMAALEKPLRGSVVVMMLALEFRWLLAKSCALSSALVKFGRERGRGASGGAKGCNGCSWWEMPV